MQQHTILIASADVLPDSEARFVELILSAWPENALPAVTRATLDQLAARLRAGDARIRATEACLLFLSRRDRLDVVDRCLGELHQANIPAVILAEDHSRWKPLQRQGVIVQPWNAQPAVAASMLFALAERQELVHQVSQELAITQRIQAGTRAEVERIHEELHLAAGVQHEFTAAPLPDMGTLDMAAIYRPVNAVSGDVYHVRRLDDDTVAFFIADAVGHGVPAALLTMVLTNSLLSGDDHHAGSHPTPGEILERLNRRLLDSSLHTGRFATAVYGTVNARTGQVCLAGAGHPAPIIAGTRGARELTTDGPLLGVFGDADFPSVVDTLAPGETLLLYTDGLEAAFPVDKSRRAERLAAGRHAHAHVEHLTELFANAGDDSPGQALERLENVLDEQCGSLHQADDITALAIRRLAAASLRRAA